MNSPLALSVALALSSFFGSDDPSSNVARDQSSPTTDATWSSETIGYLPRGLTSFGAASAGGWLYVLGGYDGTPHAYSRDGQSRAFLRINAFDPRDLRALDDVEPVQSVELVAWDGKLVRVGGLHARNAAGESADLHSTDEVALFDPSTDSWTDLPPLPEPRSSHRAVVIGDLLHVVGGWTMRGSSDGAAWCATHAVLDLRDASRGWTSREAPFRVRALGAARLGDSLCVVGGMTPQRPGVTNDVWVFDPRRQEWSDGPPFPGGGFGVAATTCEDDVFASAGTETVFRLAEKGSRWIEVGALNGGRMFHELVSDRDGSFVALGGIAGMSKAGRIRSIERVAAGGGPSPIERFVIPAPGRARNRWGCFVDGRSIVLFGGNGSLGQHDFAPENFIDETWRLDLDRLDWKRLADAPESRQSMGSALLSRGGEGPPSALAVGGFGWNEDRAKARASSWIYDVEFDEWEPGPGLPGDRSQFGLARHGDELWVFGGLDYDPSRARGEQFDHRTDVLRLPPGADAFEATGVELPGPRRAFAGAVIDGEYVLVGGMRDGFEVVRDVAAFDFEARSWRSLPSPARPRVGADLVSVGGALYLVGGRSPSSPATGLESNPSIERFDLASESWATVLDDVGCEVRHARALEVDGRLYLITLHRGNGSAEILRIDVERLSGG